MNENIIVGKIIELVYQKFKENSGTKVDLGFDELIEIYDFLRQINHYDINKIMMDEIIQQIEKERKRQAIEDDLDWHFNCLNYNGGKE